jgi:hypothetical protein
MRTAKLTLSADKKIVGLARKIAKRDRVSISSLFAGYVMARAQQTGDLEAASGPLTRKLTEIVKVPAGWDERKALEGCSLPSRHLQDRPS